MKLFSLHLCHVPLLGALQLLTLSRNKIFVVNIIKWWPKSKIFMKCSYEYSTIRRYCSYEYSNFIKYWGLLHISPDKIQQTQQIIRTTTTYFSGQTANSRSPVHGLDGCSNEPNYKYLLIQVEELVSEKYTWYILTSQTAKGYHGPNTLINNFVHQYLTE